MFEKVATTGLFPRYESALRAGERLREVAGSGARVRVIFPGAASSVVEVSVVSTSSGALAVMVFGALLGLIGGGIAFALGGSIRAASAMLLWGVLSGTMLGIWFTGTGQRSRTLDTPGARRCHDLLVGGKRALVAVVAPARRSSAVRDEIRSAGGEAFDGRLERWMIAATRAASPPLTVAT